MYIHMKHGVCEPWCGVCGQQNTTIKLDREIKSIK